MRPAPLAFVLWACSLVSGAGAQPTLPRITRTIPLPDGPAPLAMAVGASGQLWLTRAGSPTQTPVAGDLLRIDAAAGQVTLDRPVGGDPEAVACSEPFVWVVNASGDGKTPEADANSVVQLDAATGDEVQRYQVDQPYGVSAAGDVAWIAAEVPGDATVVTIAQAGSAGVTATVAGSNAAGRPVIVVGGDDVFIVTRVSESGQPGRDTVYRLDANGQQLAQQTLPTFGDAALAYADGAVFATVSNVPAGGVYRLDSGSLTPMATISAVGARGVTTANGHVWALSLDGGSIQAYDTGSGQPVTPPLTLPGRGTLLAADDQQVWVSVELDAGNELVLVSPS